MATYSTIDPVLLHLLKVLLKDTDRQQMVNRIMSFTSPNKSCMAKPFFIGKETCQTKKLGVAVVTKAYKDSHML